ncbi:hypothetical protein KI614_11615 [Dechloromonas denitrificans]|uniref:hypothetical protein n=1 Tax=Dechloromonas denitrificans TaxID=281362 RepID=UPI001CF897A8|nr:hypothetical protein [Dechloromonas denitrificans]UCV10822.1 hypothetical protein KI614_11615 [Dechloromonas denitrificans]
MNSHTIKNTFTIFVALLFSACSSIDLAPSAIDSEAKTFKGEEGKSVIYVVQNGGYSSARALFQITLNGQPQGSLSGQTYHRISAAPGTQMIAASATENERVLRLVTTPGSVVFVGVSSTIGWSSMRVGDIRKLDDEEGRQAVLEAKMAQGFR